MSSAGVLAPCASRRCASRSRRAGSWSPAAQRSIQFPAQAMLIGAATAARAPARRTPVNARSGDRARYARRLSAPLLDRIDLICQLDPVPPLTTASVGSDASAAVRERVSAAREGQRERLRGSGVFANAAWTLGSPSGTSGSGARPLSVWRTGSAGPRSRRGVTTGCCASRGRSPTSTARPDRERRHRPRRSGTDSTSPPGWPHERLSRLPADSHLIAHLAPRIAGLLDHPRERAVPGVLQLAKAS